MSWIFYIGIWGLGSIFMVWRLERMIAAEIGALSPARRADGPVGRVGRK